MLDISDIVSASSEPYVENGLDFTKYELSGLDEVNPEQNCCGKFYDLEENEHIIRYDDKETYKLINSQRTDTIFQFDTQLAKSILSDASVGAGISDPHQLTLLNALGHPGPLQSIPTVIANRDDPSEKWKKELLDKSPVMYEILKNTYGQVCYQEQLTALWQRLAGFSATEAQTSRKDIAKKRVHKMKKIKDKWIAGASKTLGKKFAEDYWSKLETFGRYAFNKCLSKYTPLTCSKTNVTKSIEEWHSSKEKPILMAYDSENKELFLDECVDIHYSGDLEVFEICFENGQVERVTMNHKFLCSDGLYHEVREIVDKGLDVIEVDVSKCRNSAEIVSQS